MSRTSSRPPCGLSRTRGRPRRPPRQPSDQFCNMVLPTAQCRLRLRRLRRMQTRLLHRPIRSKRPPLRHQLLPHPLHNKHSPGRRRRQPQSNRPRPSRHPVFWSLHSLQRRHHLRLGRLLTRRLLGHLVTGLRLRRRPHPHRALLQNLPVNLCRPTRHLPHGQQARHRHLRRVPQSPQHPNRRAPIPSS